MLVIVKLIPKIKESFILDYRINEGYAFLPLFLVQTNRNMTRH